MKKNFTYILIVLDKSSSMLGKRFEVIQSLNAFIEEQKKLKGTAKITIAQFSGQYGFGLGKGYQKNETLNAFSPIQSFIQFHPDNVSLKTVKPLTLEDYNPYGSTALYDAVGVSMDKLGKELASMSEKDRPSKVITVIVTDGEENCSVLHNQRDISAKIKEQRDVYNWEFVFMGSDISAMRMAENIGMLKEMSVQVDDKAWAKNIDALNSTVGSYRSGAARAVYSNILQEVAVENYVDRQFKVNM